MIMANTNGTRDTQRHIGNLCRMYIVVHCAHWIKGYSENIAVTAPSMFMKSKMFAFFLNYIDV